MQPAAISAPSPILHFSECQDETLMMRKGPQQVEEAATFHPTMGGDSSSSLKLPSSLSPKQKVVCSMICSDNFDIATSQQMFEHEFNRATEPAHCD